MERAHATFEIDNETREALTRLSDILHRPPQELVNDAVRAYVDQFGQRLSQDSMTTLDNLGAYRQSDPDFERAIAEFVEAETTLPDPTEGKPFKHAGPVQTEIDNLLNG